MVKANGDLLFVQGLNEPKLPLLVQSETQFMSTATPNGFEFVKDAQGKVTHLIVHGDSDDVVPMEAVQKLVDKLRHQKDIQIQFKVAEGANHFFADQMEQLTEIVEDYLTQRLQPEKQQKKAASSR